MPKGRPPTNNPYVNHKIEILQLRNCFIYKRPRSAVWQYYLQMDGVTNKKTTGVQGDIDDINIGRKEAEEFTKRIYLDALARKQAGQKPIVKKKLFDLMDDFLKEEEKRIRPYNQKEYITYATWRGKKGHLLKLKKFYENKNQVVEKIDWKKLYDFPKWRQDTTCYLKNPIEIKPPLRKQTISAELTTIRAYFAFLVKKGLIPKVPEFRKITRESRKKTRRDYLTWTQYTQVRNTVRAWANSINATPSQTYNRKVLYNSILIMTNSLLRVGTLRNLVWGDLMVAEELTKKDQKEVHIIDVREEANKKGEDGARRVLSKTVEYFNRIRELSGIPKVPHSKFPHVPPEYLNKPILKKHNQDEPLGQGTWEREWDKIKALCKHYWTVNGREKKITWYSFRHTGISMGVENKIPLITLANFAGTSVKEIELTYYHHEEESRKTWEVLSKNRIFQNRQKKQNPEVVSFDDLLDGIDVEE